MVSHASPAGRPGVDQEVLRRRSPVRFAFCLVVPFNRGHSHIDFDRPKFLITDLSKSEREALKAIYRHARNGAEAHTGDLALTLGVTPGTVTATIKRLADRGLVTHRPYHGVTFTDEGRRHAVAAIRRHRIVERFLADFLGYSWSEADRLAPTFEHEMPDEVEQRLYLALDRPATCPHGFPIPEREQDSIPVMPPLYDLEVGEGGEVALPSSIDPDIVRFLDELGVRPGVHVVVREKHPFDGPLVLKVEGQDRTLGERIARRIYIRRDNRGGSENKVNGGHLNGDAPEAQAVAGGPPAGATTGASGDGSPVLGGTPAAPNIGGTDAADREKEGTTR
jgi:DtxR family transcriptional regulator, Mn-dependent transcriptional regulator